MGNAKIVMLSGIYLILGMYSLSFQTSENIHNDSVISVGISAKAEGIANSGISLALAKMGGDAALHTFPSEQRLVDGGEVTFSAMHPTGLPLTHTYVTSIGVLNGDTVTVKVSLSYNRGRWRKADSYHVPSV